MPKIYLPNQNVLRLMITACLVIPGSAVVVFAGSLLGHKLAPSPSWSTLPVAVMILGVASMTIPVAFLSKRFGRRTSSLIGISIYALGSVFGYAAVRMESFTMLLLTGFLMGSSTAFVQQYRFAAIDCTKDKKDIPLVLSFMMMAGVVAAWIGPEVAFQGRSFIQPQYEYAGSFLIVLFMSFLASLIFWGFKEPKHEELKVSGEKRPLKLIVGQKLFIFAVMCAALGYGVMSFLMTATPISMHEMHSHSLEETKLVIQSHIIAMYLPSILTGWLMKRLGILPILFGGTCVLGLCLVIAFQGHEFMHYWWALVLLGLGWNWLFLGGTALLPETYRSSERYLAQGINDFIIFGIQGLSSLTAGVVLNLWGWNTLLVATSPVVIGLAFVTFLVLMRPPLRIRKLNQTT